jgi:hypothetical protein
MILSQPPGWQIGGVHEGRQRHARAGEVPMNIDGRRARVAQIPNP